MAYGKAGNWYVNNVEGGGGSSDYSTAEVTVVNNSKTFYGFVEGAVLKDDLQGNTFLSTKTEIEEGNTYIITIVLYKNYQYIVLTIDDSAEINLSLDGNISYADSDALRVAGNGTITISDRT